MSKDDRDNHSNQCNPNNDAFWESRGYDERPDDWGAATGKNRDAEDYEGGDADPDERQRESADLEAIFVDFLTGERKQVLLGQLCSEHPRLVILCTAPWCGLCKMLSPTMEALAEDFRDRIKFVCMDSDENSDIVSRLAIHSLPTLVFYKDGRQAFRMIGAHPKKDIETAMEKYLI